MIRARFIKALLRLFACLPLPVVHGVGTLVGWLLVILPNQVRRVTRTNITLCFPDMPPARRRRLVVQSLLESGKTAVELGPLWLWPREKVAGLIKGVHGRELVDAALAQGKGVVVLGPHLAAWELAALAISLDYARRCPWTILYRPPRMTELEDMLCSARQRFGATLVPTDVSGVKRLIRTLEAGGMVGIAPDQEPGVGKSVFAPFFHIPAKTMVLVAGLMARSDAPAVYVYTQRLPRGRGFTVHYVAPPPGLDDGDEVRAARQLNRGVEYCVRQLPAQYQWGYKRFRSRPPGEPKLY